MTRGTPHISIRIDPDDLVVIDREIRRVNRSKGCNAYTRTSFIKSAVQERIAKLKRGRTRK